MLDAIRTHAQSWIAKLILALISIPFALWGIDSYFRGGAKGVAVATVGDDQINEREFRQVLQNQRDAAQQSGGKVDIDNPEFRKRILDQLIDSRLLAYVASKQGMRVTDAQIGNMLSNVPVFMENGAFSETRLQAWLRQRGLSHQELLAMIHQDLIIRQLQTAYGEGSVVPKGSVAQLAKHLAQQREVSEVVYGAQAYLSASQPDDKAVEAEYKANAARFATPPQARVQYLILSLDGIEKQIEVGEDKAKQFYEANKARYQEPEQRRASHILIKTEAGMAPAAKAEAKAKADKLLQELRANPGKFADLAKQHSADPGSAARGGDLGNFTREMMVKPFADAAYSMKVGELSGIVETQFGYHIIRLDGITPATSLGYAVVRDDIIQEMKRQEAQRKYAEVADRFGNLVYEKPESLEPAAKELGLSVAETGWISRNAAQPALLNNPKLMDAVFSPEALEKKQNTDAIEVAPSTLVAARVLEHKPAGQRPLAEVAPAIRQQLALQAARDKAIAAGKAALAAAQAGQSPSGLGAPIMVSRMQPMNLPQPALKAIFKASGTVLPSYAGVEMPDGYRLYKIGKVQEGKAEPAQEITMHRDMARLQAQEELRAYLDYSKARVKIEINQQAIATKVD
jgi:peptidyl-prolyl cis-trans isomerase D